MICKSCAQPYGPLIAGVADTLPPIVLVPLLEGVVICLLMGYRRCEFWALCLHERGAGGMVLLQNPDPRMNLGLDDIQSMRVRGANTVHRGGSHFRELWVGRPVLTLRPVPTGFDPSSARDTS